MEEMHAVTAEQINLQVSLTALHSRTIMPSFLLLSFFLATNLLLLYVRALVCMQ